MSSSLLPAVGVVIVAGVAHLGGLIWMLVRAFKLDPRWGLGLVAPYILASLLGAAGLTIGGALLSVVAFTTAIVFVVRHWRLAKSPFFVLLASWIVGVLGAVGLVTAFVSEATSNPGSTNVLEIREVMPQLEAVPAPTPRPETRVVAPVAHASADVTAGTINPTLASGDKKIVPQPVNALTWPPRSETNSQELKQVDVPPVATALDPIEPPVAVSCASVQPNPDESVHFVTLCLTNSSPRIVRGLKMHLTYFDYAGVRLGDWTTSRELDQCLEGRKSLDISQPAFFLPLTARSIRIEVKRVQFADGTDWTP